MDNQMQNILQDAGIKVKEIAGKNYTIELLPAGQGLTVFNSLIKLLGPAVANIADKTMNEEFIMPEDNNMLTMAVSLLVEKMDQVDVTQLIQLLTHKLSCDGAVVDFDKHFRGKYGELMAVVEWILRENFQEAFTFWLKEKGLSIPTLVSLTKRQATSSEESSNE